MKSFRCDICGKFEEYESANLGVLVEMFISKDKSVHKTAMEDKDKSPLTSLVMSINLENGDDENDVEPSML